MDSGEAALVLTTGALAVQIPLLWPSQETPVGEVGSIKTLNAHLSALQYSIQSWEAALILYQWSKSPPPQIARSVARLWRFMACNECVLELYHLRARLKNIRSSKLRECPSIRAMVDSEQLKSAAKRLEDYFPDIEGLRHAAAHKGQNEASPEVHAPDGEFALSGFREPDVISAAHEGRIHRLAITSESLSKMIRVVEEFAGAFEPAAEALKRQVHLD